MTTRRIKVLAIILASTAISPSWAQPAKQKDVVDRRESRKAGQPASPAEKLPIINVPYTKEVLPNGLTLIVHEDRRAPVVSVVTYYHVGSANETEGRTGFAHLFEHLVFNGSEHANDDWFKFMNEIGATGMNGTTNQDRTNYFQTVPKSGLDRVLWYESDRMVNLLPAIDQAKLDEQRKVVQNEKRQGETSPLGQVPEMWFASTYPKGHPYSTIPIGSMEDLDAASLEDVKTFHRKWYGPGNAVLVLAGDITPAEAREKVMHYYGGIPSGPPLKRQEENIAKMVDHKRGTVEADVANPDMIKGWNVPGWASRDAQLLRLAAAALGDGEDSPMRKRLIRELKLASDVEVRVDLLELGSQFQISATPRPGVSLQSLQAAIDEVMATFLREGMSQERLDRIRFARYAANVRAQTSTLMKAVSLAEAQLYAGTPEFVHTRQEIARDATPASILAAARQWLSDGSFTLEVLPFKRNTVAGKDVDRKVKPALGAPAELFLPPLQQATLSNGVKVMLAERHDVPTVSMSMLFDFGELPDRDPASVGLNSAFSLATRGTNKLSTVELSRRRQELAANIGWTVLPEMSRFSLNALKVKLDESLDLYADMLLNPSFPKEEWDRQLVIARSEFEDAKKTPSGTFRLIRGELLYGPGHPYALVSTPDKLERWKTEDLRTHYHKWVRPDLATILIVGDTTLAEIMPKLEQRLGGWRARGAKPVQPPLPAASRPTQPRIILVDQPGAESSTIAVLGRGPARSAEEYDLLLLANTVLGGGFLSRLNLNLREEKGWSYGANSGLSPHPLLGEKQVTTQVQADKTAAAMREIDRELREFGSSRLPTPEEVVTAKNAMLLGVGASLQDPGNALSLYREAQEYGLPENYWNTYVSKMREFAPEQVQAAAARLHQPSEATWLVSGDLSKIEADIRKLNLGEVMVYDAEGKRAR